MEQENIKKTQNNVPEINKEKTGNGEKDITMAIVAYIVFFIPLLTEAKNDEFVKYHVKQGMVLFVAWFAAAIVGAIPFFGWILAQWLMLAVLILLVIGIMNAYNGKKKPLPLIGKYADSFKI
jgi:uncharacterized membrane protein